MTDQTPAPRRKIAGERPQPARPTAAQSMHHTGDTGSVPSGSRRPFARVPGWLLVALAVLLTAAVTFDVVLAVRDAQRDKLAKTRSTAITSAFSTAPAQAEKAAAQVLGYDYQTLQQDAREAEQFLTPAFAATFQKTVGALLEAPAKQVKAHVEAKVMSSGIASASPSKVDVVLFIDQVSRTTRHEKPQTSLNRVVFAMVKEGDRWLVDDITAL